MLRGFGLGLGLVVLCLFVVVWAADKNKPHGHRGILTPFTGKHLPYELNKEQASKLIAGQAVIIKERDNVTRRGRGLVLQDVKAPVLVVMNAIRALGRYPAMVPHVKKVQIYRNQTTFSSPMDEAKELLLPSTSTTGAQFTVGFPLVSFGYFLSLQYHPELLTLTWTLDYDHTSDFDDNIGHWQVMPHPTKPDHSRVLYSTEVRLFDWVPRVIVDFLTNTALVEATSWLQRESESVALSQQKKAPGQEEDDDDNLHQKLLTILRPCFLESIDESTGTVVSLQYDTRCSLQLLPSVASSVNKQHIEL